MALEERNKTIFIDRLSVPPKRIYSFIKRLFDIIASVTAIIVFMPLMLIISAVIVLQDGKKPIFAQTRMTKKGKRFRMYKFRSMYVGAEKELDILRNRNEADGPVFKMSEDPRVTRFGRFLRRSSLDELPQLFNILGGSMSFVGPRPPLPEEVEKYTPYQIQRLCVKGGLTCYWQCSGRSNICFDDWVNMDIQYIKDRSCITDIKIIFRTFGAVISGEGAK